jgi:Zn-dependent peptidase ImmA (M78 family)
MRLAREARGWTQGDLAKNSGVPQGTISKAENGLLELDDDRLEAIAAALGYPPKLLQIDAHAEAVPRLFNRKLKTTPAGELRAAQARVNLARLHLSRLMDGVDVEHELVFPTLDLDELDGDIEQAAQLVRRTWRLPMGPVRDLTAAVEAAGGIIAELNFGTKKIDAAAQWPRGGVPYFFVRPGLPPDRYRFNLAHEIGHMVLHHVPDPKREDEAHHFAGALLVPAAELRPQIPTKLNLAELYELKHYWGVSMAMLVMRAAQIGAITERQKRSYFQMANARGMRNSEPGQLPTETPKLIGSVVAAYVEQMGYSPAEVSQVALMSETEFVEQFGRGLMSSTRGLHALPRPKPA